LISPVEKKHVTQYAKVDVDVGATGGFMIVNGNTNTGTASLTLCDKITRLDSPIWRRIIKKSKVNK
jgi:hypothetical protein